MDDFLGGLPVQHREVIRTDPAACWKYPVQYIQTEQNRSACHELDASVSVRK